MDGTETTSGHISLQDGSKTLLAPTDNNDLGTIKYMAHIDNQPTYSDVMCIVFPFGRSAMLILFSSLFFLAHAPLAHYWKFFWPATKADDTCSPWGKVARIGRGLVVEKQQICEVFNPQSGISLPYSQFTYNGCQR